MLPVEDAVELLAGEELLPLGRIVGASNATLFAQVGDPTRGVHAVYKPRAGERPLWDFPTGTLCQREAAAFVVSDRLGWDVVPPTVLRDGPMGVGSVQLFVVHDPRRHYFTLVEDASHHAQLIRMVAFDLLVNNADRKASHVLLGGDGRIQGCDHGLTFHVHPKLRTVIWDLGGRRVDAELRGDLSRLRAELGDATSELSLALAPLLSATEVTMLARRAEVLEAVERLPEVEESRRPYPWPLL